MLRVNVQNYYSECKRIVKLRPGYGAARTAAKSANSSFIDKQVNIEQAQEEGDQFSDCHHLYTDRMYH